MAPGALRPIEHQTHTQETLDAYHGHVRFIGSRAHPDKTKRTWVSYIAKFTDGHCEKIGIEEVDTMDRTPTPPPPPPPPTPAEANRQAIIDQHHKVSDALSRFQSCLWMTDDPAEVRRQALAHSRAAAEEAKALLAMVNKQWDDDTPRDMFDV